MGLLVTVDGGRAPDLRLRKALRPLAAFGLIHGTHEWLEMFQQIEKAMGQKVTEIPEGVRLVILALSFIALAAFGSYLLANSVTAQRVIMLVPLGMETIWVFGLLILKAHYSPEVLWSVVDVWTRYVLAIPAGILAAVGLVAQQRAFRRAGLVRFGQDSLWAAVAFGWYGLVGQIFVRTSPLPPSNFLNQDLFLSIFGFPIQLFRAAMAIGASIFVVRFLRAFQVETDLKIADLQAARLREAQQRETMRGELYRRVVAAQEAERQRIARDLHDETGQALTAIGLGLRSLSGARKGVKSFKHSEENLHHLENLAAHSLNELQRLIGDLRPSHLDDLGLPAAIRWYAGNVQERTDLKVKVDITGSEVPLSDEVKIATFRIVQEALNNVIKHADARQVTIQMEFKKDHLYVTVQDNGCGFDIGLTNFIQSTRPSLGLAGMQERAALLGGKVTIKSRPGEGTIIGSIIPIHPGDEMEVKDDNSPATGG